MSVSGFDGKIIQFDCPTCGDTHPHPISEVKFHHHAHHDPADRMHWTLSIGACPGCAAKGQISTHHLNCNIEDGHPHPSAAHVGRIIAHLGAPSPVPMPAPTAQELADRAMIAERAASDPTFAALVRLLNVTH